VTGVCGNQNRERNNMLWNPDWNSKAGALNILLNIHLGVPAAPERRFDIYRFTGIEVNVSIRALNLKATATVGGSIPCLYWLEFSFTELLLSPLEIYSGSIFPLQSEDSWSAARVILSTLRLRSRFQQAGWRLLTTAELRNQTNLKYQEK